MLFTQLKQPVYWTAVLSFVLLLGFSQVVDASSTKDSDSGLIAHGASSGGKGKDSIKLKAPKGLPANSCVAFIDAKVVDVKRRFGKAEVVSLPAKGCNPANESCKVSVSWKHAPAGILNYRVKAYWNVKTSGC